MTNAGQGSGPNSLRPCLGGGEAVGGTGRINEAPVAPCWLIIRERVTATTPIDVEAKARRRPTRCGQFMNRSPSRSLRFHATCHHWLQLLVPH